MCSLHCAVCSGQHAVKFALFCLQCAVRRDRAREGQEIQKNLGIYEFVYFGLHFMGLHELSFYINELH